MSALGAFLVAKVGEPDRDDVAGSQEFFGNSLLVDVDTVPASQVDDPGQIVRAFLCEGGFLPAAHLLRIVPIFFDTTTDKDFAFCHRTFEQSVYRCANRSGFFFRNNKQLELVSQCVAGFVLRASDQWNRYNDSRQE